MSVGLLLETEFKEEEKDPLKKLFVNVALKEAFVQLLGDIALSHLGVATLVETIQPEKH